MAAAQVVDSYLAGIPGESRRVDRSEWGISVAAEAAGGWPLDVGLRLADGLLRAQAFAAPAQEAISPWVLLNWNRRTRFIRFASAGNGDIWIHADIPAADVDERALDRLLGLVAEGAIAVRNYASGVRTAVG